MSIACGITNCSNGLKIEVYDIKTKQEIAYLQPDNKSIHEVIEDIITQYGDNVGNIVIYNDFGLERNVYEDFKTEYFEKYENLVYVATQAELSFRWYLTSKAEYSIEDKILLFDTDKCITLYENANIDGRIMSWNQLDMRYYKLTGNIDFHEVKKMFHIELNQVHIVFGYNQEEVNLIYGAELYNYGFKSINFIGPPYSNSLVLARHLISDPDVSMLVQTYISLMDGNLQNFIFRDWGFIQIPKAVKEYESKTDIMGVDFGSSRCVLAVSTSNGIQAIPFDPSSADFWTESVISFDGERSVIGKEAVKRLETKSDSVIFDMKLLCNSGHRWNRQKQLTWSFSYNFKQREEPRFVTMTSDGSKEFSLTDINKIFLEQMREAASEYQKEFNNGECVNKAVITVPGCSLNKWEHSLPLVHSAVKAAKSVGIEIIDIIEETHADLLYYLSKEEYSEMIKPGMKIAVFDFGGGNCIERVYEISEQNGKRYGTCVGELHMRRIANSSGRDIDDIIMKKLEESIPEESRNNLKLRTLETAKSIKHRLSSEEEIK